VFRRPGALDAPCAVSYGRGRLDGGGAGVGDDGERRVLPEVVGLPPGNLVEQAGFGPAVQGCRGQNQAPARAGVRQAQRSLWRG
jgi:hypothetical protein